MIMSYIHVYFTTTAIYLNLFSIYRIISSGFYKLNKFKKYWSSYRADNSGSPRSLSLARACACSVSSSPYWTSGPPTSVSTSDFCNKARQVFADVGDVDISASRDRLRRMERPTTIAGPAEELDCAGTHMLQRIACRNRSCAGSRSAEGAWKYR
jgi:hypothetical protein